MIREDKEGSTTIENVKINVLVPSIIYKQLLTTSLTRKYANFFHAQLSRCDLVSKVQVYDWWS